VPPRPFERRPGASDPRALRGALVVHAMDTLGSTAVRHRLDRGPSICRRSTARRAQRAGAIPLGLVCGIVAFAGVACSRGEPPAAARVDRRPSSILLVTIDTLRADHVHAYGYPRETTPHLDALARDGVLFETAYAPSSATGPSHATLFTARQPVAHGVVHNGIPLDASIPTIASLLAAQGYRTAAFVSSYPVARAFGFAQGFGHYDDAFAEGGGTMTSKRWQREKGTAGALDRRAAATVDLAERWISTHADGTPLFLWVHLFDPHAPYSPPPPYDTAFSTPDGGHRERVIDLYDGEIRYTDHHLGRLVEAFERTAGSRRGLVVVTSDHGEGLWDHGYAGHNRDVWEEEVRVPLIVRWRDGVPGGVRVTEPVHLIDVLPTLLAAAGAGPPPPGTGGIDLLAALDGAAALSPERPIYLTRPYYGQRGRKRLRQSGFGFGLRQGEWKLLVAPDEQRLDLFDLARDPDERHDVAPEETARAAALARMVQDWHAAELTARGGEPPSVPRDVRKKLRALGYVQ